MGLAVTDTSPLSPPGGGLCPVWHLHHPALHTTQLVRDLLQVTLGLAGGPGVPLPMGAWVGMCSPKHFPMIFTLRMIQNSFVDMENMFELFNEEQEVGVAF